MYNDYLPNLAIEADFLWKDGLKILNSGLILKTFTHARVSFLRLARD